MDQITNSRLKEAIRQRNESVARNEERQIRQKLQQDLAVWNKWIGRLKKISIGGGFFCAVIVVAYLGTEPGSGIGIGSVCGCALYFILKSSIKNKKKDLETHAISNIQNSYDAADAKTQREIQVYDEEVRQNCQRILKNPSGISSMVDYVVMMFQRMVSHADAGAHMKFVEADFTYIVRINGISFKYQSNYTNPQDDFNFNKERYRDLKTDAECEGLAQVLAKQTIQRMKSMAPPNSLNITVSHNDAEVTLHYKAANKNFVVARDIL